jgi:hypothetical protein
MFVLLARDPGAPEAIREWAYQRQRAIGRGTRPQSDLAMVEEAYQCADAMIAWRFANAGKWRK